MKLGISILTNGRRRIQVQDCIQSILSGTSRRPLFFGIFNNGSTDDTAEYLDSLQSTSDVHYLVESIREDKGCACGSNRAAALVWDCEYTLHVESDFILLPQDLSLEDEGWLDRAVEFMDSGECDYLYLRRMVDELDIERHWWSQWMTKLGKTEGRYIRCPGFWWSNNPHLRRNSSIIESGCLPLNENIDGKKGTSGWCKPEMSASKPKKAWIHKWGLFVHEVENYDGIDRMRQRKGCGKTEFGCKYGFFKTNGKPFCQACVGDDYRDMAEHHSRFKGVKMETKKAGKPFTVVTVDNGCGFSKFEKILGTMNGATGIYMLKGPVSIPSTKNIKVVGYDENLSSLKGDAALFVQVGDSNRSEVLQLMKSGLPCVLHVSAKLKEIEHEKNSFVYQDDSWATKWLLDIRDDSDLVARVKTYWREKLGEVKHTEPSVEIEFEAVYGEDDKPLVTVITPTFRRSPSVIRRCIDCLLLQTEKRWEQLICSNGPNEPLVQALVEEVNDPRIKYYHLEGLQKDGDYGNTARAKMLSQANGKFVCFVDDDNIILPTYLEKMTGKIGIRDDVEFAVCDIMHFGPLNESEIGKPPIVLKGEPVKLYHIDPLQVMVDTRTMQEIGWDTERGYLSDGVTLEKLGNNFKHVKLNEVLGIHM